MKLEQYTKKPYPHCQPTATGYYTTEDGELYYHKGTKKWYYDEDMDDEALEHIEYFFEPSPMEVKDAKALKHISEALDVLESMIRSNGSQQPIRRGKRRHQEVRQALRDFVCEAPQLQPPVISAEEFLKEKGISNKIVGQTNQYKEVRIIDLLTEYLQRQGQKTNQNKL